MKRAQTSMANLLMFGLLLIFIMGFGLIVSISIGAIKPVLDSTIPRLEGLPTVNNLAIGNYTTKALSPISSLSSNAGWILGGVYIVALVGILGIAYGYRISGQKVLLVLFLGISILVILASILVSNIYQGIYENGGTIGTQLQQLTLFSWLMLYSPVVMIIITFFGGAIIFSGFSEEVTVA